MERSRFYKKLLRHILEKLWRPAPTLSPSFLLAQAIFEPHFSRINSPIFSKLVILHTYPPMRMEQSVPKRQHIKFIRRGITQKKAYNLQNTAKIWNQERQIALTMFFKRKREEPGTPSARENESQKLYFFIIKSYLNYYLYFKILPFLCCCCHSIFHTKNALTYI